MKVKICGINKTEYAEMAASLGADYLGLLVGITHIAEDKLTKEQAKNIIGKSNIGESQWVMVTHLKTAKEIIPILAYLNINHIQLHDEIDISDIIKIRKKFPTLFIIKAIHILSSDSVDIAKKYLPYVDALILDSMTETRLGGTGKTHDWSISKKICNDSDKPVFLAGGLTPLNLQDAILTVNPYGVDVNSGVETSDGQKDYDKIKKFIQIAKNCD